MNLNNAITFLNDPPNAYMLSFAKFPSGPMDAIQRIPDDQPGIYFWYRAFNYPTDKENFSIALKRDLNAPKFPTRTGQVAPYYEVSVASSSQLNNKKTKALDQAIKNNGFREHMQQLLNIGVLLQAPLYIGKSKNIKKRMETHLSDDSQLSLRLAEHNLNISDTALLVIPMDGDINLNLDNMDDELLYEELFSRLFNPTFNLRIG